jgi:DNA repair exonuclease SbcCD ATPase subunit
MSQPKTGSPLVQAVRAFDDELERFTHAASSACRRSLDSRRELEKAAQAVTEAAKAETTMQARAQELLLALKAVQEEQQSRAVALRARAEEIQARFAEYEKLAERYQKLRDDGAGLVEAAHKLRDDTRPDQPAPDRASLLAGLASLEERVAALRTDARGLAGDAQTARFEDLASEAQSVEQTLSALRNKLLLAQRAAAAVPPTDA